MTRIFISLFRARLSVDPTLCSPRSRRAHPTQPFERSLRTASDLRCRNDVAQSGCRCGVRTQGDVRTLRASGVRHVHECEAGIGGWPQGFSSSGLGRGGRALRPGSRRDAHECGRCRASLDEHRVVLHLVSRDARQRLRRVQGQRSRPQPLGEWTLLWKRKLDTGHKDDIVLEPGKTYPIGLAVHDVNVTARFHHVSFPLRLGLGAEPAGINALRLK